MSAPPAATDSKTSGTGARKSAILAIICISYFMVILDNSIIFTGLPRTESAMHFSPTGLTWVSGALTAAAALLAVALVAVLVLIAWRGRARPSQRPALEAQATRVAAGIRS